MFRHAATRTFSLSRASLTGFVDLAVGTGGPETFFSAISGLVKWISVIAIQGELRMLPFLKLEEKDLSAIQLLQSSGRRSWKLSLA